MKKHYTLTLNEELITEWKEKKHIDNLSSSVEWLIRQDLKDNDKGEQDSNFIKIGGIWYKKGTFEHLTALLEQRLKEARK